MAKFVFACSLALTIIATYTTDAQFPYPGAFPSLYSPRLPWTPLPYSRPFAPALPYGASPTAAASSLVPSALYPAPIRRPLPLSPYPLAPSPYAPANVPFGSTFAASYPASSYAPAPLSPISPIPPSPFIPPTGGFSGIRFAPSRPQFQVTKLDDL